MDQVLSAAEGRGLSETRLVTEAGLTGAELNMAREYGDIRVAALVALGNQVDLRLIFVPHQSEGRQTREKLINDIKAGVFFHRGA